MDTDEPLSATPPHLQLRPFEQQVTHSVIDSICSRKYPRVVDYGKMVSPSQWRQLATTLTTILKKFGRIGSFDVSARVCGLPLFFPSLYRVL